MYSYELSILDLPASFNLCIDTRDWSINHVAQKWLVGQDIASDHILAQHADFPGQCSIIPSSGEIHTHYFQFEWQQFAEEAL